MLPEQTSRRMQAPADLGVGLDIPPRRADCSGVRPSWYPFVYNVCDLDGPVPPEPLERWMHLPPPPPA